MRRKFLSSVALWMAGAGWSLAQPYGPTPWVPPGPGFLPPGIAAAPAGARPNWGAWPAPAAEPAAGAKIVPTGAPDKSAPKDNQGGTAECAGPACPPAEPPCPPVYFEQPCHPGYFIWASLEHLRWSVKDGPLPAAIVTTGDPLAPLPGGLDDATTRVVIGNQDIDYDTATGGRIAVGVYDPCMNLGFEGGGFRLENLVTRLRAASDDLGNPVLARPFTSIPGNQDSVLLIAAPGTFAGTVEVSSETRFWSGEANVATNVLAEEGWSIDMIGGFRYFDLKEDVVISDASTVLPGGGGLAFFNNQLVPPGPILTTTDRFDTRNRFYGGQVGFRTEAHLGRCFANFKGIVAVGSNAQSVTISGNSALWGQDGSLLGYQQRGLLALESNGGRQTHRSVTAIPIFEFNLGCDITDWLRVFGGYTFIYWAQVTRPGDQIDTNINPVQVPTSPSFNPQILPRAPRNPFDRSDFWAQGLNFGVAIRY